MLLRQTILYLPAQFLAPAAQFVSMLMWTWWLAPEEMGAFVLVTSSQELAFLFALSWFSTFSLRYMPDRSDRAAYDRYLGTETTLMLLLTLPQLAAAAISVEVIDGLERGLGPIAVVTAYFVTRGLNQHYAERARAQSDILAYTLLQTAGPVGGLVVGLAVMETMGASTLGLLGAYAVAQAIGSLVVAPMIGVSLRPRPVDRDILRRAIGYGGPVLGLNLLGWVAENNVRFVVEHQAGAVTFGLLAVGWGIGRRCASVASMLVMAAAFPLASRLLNQGDRDAAMAQLKTNTAILFAVLLPTVAGLAVVGDLLIDLAVAEVYRETTKAVLGLSVLAGALRYLHLHSTDQNFVLERKFALAATVSVFEGVVVSILAAIGLAEAGLVGTVAGAAAGSAMAVVLSGWLAVTRLGFSYPLGDLARIVTSTVFMAGALSATPYPHSAPGLALAVLAGGIYYVAAMGLLYAPVWLPRLRAARA